MKKPYPARTLARCAAFNLLRLIPTSKLCSYVSQIHRYVSDALQVFRRITSADPQGKITKPRAP